mgnify:CR=1 FL=1
MAILHDAAGGDCRYRSGASVLRRGSDHGGAFRADGGRGATARSRPRPADLVFAQGLHSADPPVPRRLPLLHLRRAAAGRRSRPTCRPTRSSPSPAPARPRAAPRRCSPWATSRSCATSAAREALAALGHETTIGYLTAMCGLVLRETGLLPHANPGVMTREEIAGAARGHRQPGHHARIDQRAAVRKGRRALRLARQASGRAAGDDPAGRRTESAVHHRHPDRHRRDARGADRGAAGDPRPASKRTATSRK